MHERLRGREIERIFLVEYCTAERMVDLKLSKDAPGFFDEFFIRHNKTNS